MVFRKEWQILLAKNINNDSSAHAYARYNAPIDQICLRRKLHVI